MPKSDAAEPRDLNLIPYRAMHSHGADSSVQGEYMETASRLEVPGKLRFPHFFNLNE